MLTNDGPSIGRQWAITMAFYSAVHLAKAIALKYGQTRAKGERYHDFYSRMMRHLPITASEAYERLKHDCLDIRYKQSCFSRLLGHPLQTTAAHDGADATVS